MLAAGTLHIVSGVTVPVPLRIYSTSSEPLGAQTIHGQGSAGKASSNRHALSAEHMEYTSQTSKRSPNPSATNAPPQRPIHCASSARPNPFPGLTPAAVSNSRRTVIRRQETTFQRGPPGSRRSLTLAPYLLHTAAASDMTLKNGLS